MVPVSDALAAAIQFHQSGQLPEAESLYRQILQADPAHFDAWHLIGVLACQCGNNAAGADCIQRALAFNPNQAEAHYNLGKSWEAQGMPQEAEACYLRALELKPAYADAGFNLAGLYHAQGKLEEAARGYQRILQAQPANSRAHFRLGTIWQTQRRFDQAITAFQKAIRLQPNLIEAMNELGNVYKHLGKWQEAEACYLRVIAERPESALAYCNLGVVRHDMGDIASALDCFRRAIVLEPEYSVAHYNLATVLKDRGDLAEAAESYHRALQLKPDYAMAHFNLGIVFQTQGELEAAATCYERAARLQPDELPARNNLGVVCHALGRLEVALECFQQTLQHARDYPRAHNNMGIVHQELGQITTALECYQRALELEPDCAAFHSNILLAHQYRHDATLAELAELHAAFDRRHAAPLRPAQPVHHQDHDPDRRLRLGFVSPDFGRHPVGYFLVRVLENLDPTECEVVCYSDRIRRDDLTARFQSAATTWREVTGWSDVALAGQIVDDRIDILFDLAGHTGHNRLLAMARKPAPIQITWAGYVGTTGLATMDYILADRHEIPPGAEAAYREKVLRMPDGYVTYDPPDYAPAVSPLPALANGHVVFGSFNNRAKLDAETLRFWAEILRRVPRSRLVLKYRGMNDRLIVSELERAFARAGVDPSRLECQGQSPHSALLAEYQCIDLALDPLPYNGGLTTCEALWMGVPVLTCPGETFASRHTLSHLSTIGLTETIARTPAELVEKAVNLANDLPRLAHLRGGLRARMAASPLCDGPRFAENLTRILRGAWRAWCADERSPV